MRFAELQTVVTEYLTNNVGAEYTYHNIDHTLQVLEAAEVIGRHEGLNEHDLLLVRTGALLHDIGYVSGPDGHEQRSCLWAREHLPEYGYGQEAIDSICTIIESTRVPQNPPDHLSEVVCDADLSNLGSIWYDEGSERMRREYSVTKPEKTDAQWLDEQIRFLSDRTFFTEAARRMFDEQKQLNLERLKDRKRSSSLQVAPVDQPPGSSEAHPAPGHRVTTSELLKDATLAIMGVLLASIALKNFLVPNRFFDGGVTGLSLLVHELNHWNLGLLIVVFNIPLMIAAYFSAGKRFAMGMVMGVVLLGISLEIMPSFPATGDKLLVAVFGGAFLGIGVGLAMRAGAALDGIEVLALYTLKRTSFTIAEIILGINIIIFAIAAFSFGVETALYSILTYFTATRCIDYVVEGLEAFTGVTIISSRSEEIKHQLVNNLGRGITVYKGQRGFLPGSFHVSNDCDIIFTIITRLELHKLKSLIADVDPNAFVFASAIKDASGGILARRRKH